ncbi:hypothetical protein CDD80_6357 [Ophiocordyceps camponoti-rufipedis]|uniref:Carboxymuconolactone decarboxylase-like domain-containing protein n=1 Tax=Ophiocordyceps camponoti-rufipedis TaxID=2004952 RepID=A0A2C5ZG75_9HYPO|nr:hypothetical protein CDD80_6357 [Ophiocordyceps camponoti-rufipedis]
MRLPYVTDPPPTTSAEDAAIVQRIAARRAPRPLQPLDLTLLHAPAVADGWNSFLGAVRTGTSLDAAVRELAICRVAVCNGAWYEWHHHAPLAVYAGVAEAALAAVRRSEALVADARPGELGEREWAALLYTDEMTRNVRVKDDTFALVHGLFNDREVVELTTTIAAYNCVSRFLVALDVGERNSSGPEEASHS